MKEIIVFSAIVLILSWKLYTNTAPVDTNVTAQQRGDSRFMVDVYYNAYDANINEMELVAEVTSNYWVDQNALLSEKYYYKIVVIAY